MLRVHSCHRSPGFRTPARALLFFTAALLLSGCASFSGGGGSGTPLAREIEAIIQAPPLDQVHWGILVVDAETGETLYNRNAHRKFVPASNMKILATSAALTLLGPEYRYRTEVWGVGDMDQASGRLGGDLVLRARGDPTLSERFYPSAEAPLDSLAHRLWDAGLRSVDGALVVDASAWDSTTVAGSWMVANLPGNSSATGGAFAVAEGILTIEVTGGAAAGEPARARWWPAAPPDFLGVHYLTVHPDSATRGRRVEYLPESKRLLVSGRIHPGEVDTVRVPQRDPVPLASNAFLLALERRGIEVEAGARIAWDVGEPLGRDRCIAGPSLAPGTASEGGPGDPTTGPRLPHCFRARQLGTLESPTMGQIVEAILEPSQNWMTEQLVHTLGAELGEEGSWSQGFRVEEEVFTEVMGVDSLDFSFRDGSGLSAYNLVTPRGLVRIFSFMRNSPHGELYRHALAEPGEQEGTLRSRLDGLEGRVFAKTGTISNVNSLSGYLTGAGGRELIFSILTNGSGLPSNVVRQGIDAVVRAASRR